MNDINDDEEKRQNSAVRQKRSCLISENKSCEIGNQMFFNVMISFSKTKDKLVMTRILQSKTI